MQIDLNTLQQCKFLGKDVNEIYYNNVKIWPIETILNFIDPVPEGDYLSFAPVINNDGLHEERHWMINFKIFKYYYYEGYFNNLFDNTNGIVFGEKRIDKFINGQFIEGTWQPIRFEENIDILYNEILRVRWSDRLNVNWNDIKTQYNATDSKTKVNINAVCQLKQNNNYSIVNDECYLYGKLKPFKDNTGNYIDEIVKSDDINRFFMFPNAYQQNYIGNDFIQAHEHFLICHPIHKLELLDPTIVLDDKLGDNINVKCYNYIASRNFGWFNPPKIINNLEVEFTENIDDDWFKQWPVNLGSHPFYEQGTVIKLIRVNNFKLTVNDYVNNLNEFTYKLFYYNQFLEYVKMDYSGLLNSEIGDLTMFTGAGENVEHPVLVKRGGAATVDRQAIGLGDNWIIKDFDEE